LISRACVSRSHTESPMSAAESGEFGTSLVHYFSFCEAAPRCQPLSSWLLFCGVRCLAIVGRAEAASLLEVASSFCSRSSLARRARRRIGGFDRRGAISTTGLNSGPKRNSRSPSILQSSRAMRLFSSDHRLCFEPSFGSRFQLTRQPLRSPLARA
jgi:hypothetical protein